MVGSMGFEGFIGFLCVGEGEGGFLWDCQLDVLLGRFARVFWDLNAFSNLGFLGLSPGVSGILRL